MSKLKKITLFFTFFVLILQFFNTSSIDNASANNLSKPESVVVSETSSGRVLYSKNPDKKLPIASTTKILTAIIAIENGGDLDIKHEIKKDAVGIEGSSIYLRAGEHLSLRELLYGLMLRSGNDSAVAIADIVSGGTENFVKLMNEYSYKLGLENSNFVTVNGLHDDNHYSSALDMAKITAYALKNETFSEIVKTKEKIISNDFDKKNGYRFLKNKNKLLSMVEGADGVKTGYTKKAGKCFVGSATRDGMQVVCVVLNSNTMFEECASFLEKAFKEYKMTTLFKAGQICEFETENKKLQKIPIYIKKDIILPINNEEFNKIYAKVNLNKNLDLPISKDDEIGTFEIYREKDLIFSTKIYTIDIESEPLLIDYFEKVIKIF